MPEHADGRRIQCRGGEFLWVIKYHRALKSGCKECGRFFVKTENQYLCLFFIRVGDT